MMERNHPLAHTVAVRGDFMNETVVTITRAGKPFGSAHIERQGLYLIFSCACHLEQAELLRLCARSEAGEVALGVLVPNGDAWELRTRIPAKRFAGDISVFVAGEEIVEQEKPKETFVPIVEGEAFSHLDRVQDAVLTEQDGQVGILIGEGTPEEAELPPDDAPAEVQSISIESPTGQ